jgi:purine-binding chemotaxis protein CheW
MKTEVTKLVTFQLGVDLFAADVFSVERVLRFVAPNTIPDVPRWIEGVIEHRGKVIPVVDMRRRIGLDDVDVTPETRTLVFTSADGWIGAIVDAVHEVAVVPAASVTPPPKMFRGLSAEFVKGIAKVRDQLVIVLDVDRVLTSADRIAFEAAVQASVPAEAAARG